ncbi:hypothetical protein D187_009988 [Cystobacter fuscus DSM 2262]|uniref:Uncharacterized protein n=1 Tax=Cystobacter fuscus (strain ATCC 25194 / DSM 2262 / NBRC 100088 / M29) TaxID=1242864 RepID=S9QLE4_CYSF2|nr:hypothetical protein D187_009988 [Cystobacter fuscus DSM 2262]
MAAIAIRGSIFEVVNSTVLGVSEQVPGETTSLWTEIL